MGFENLNLDLEEQDKLKVTTPGEAGYQGAWDKKRLNPPASAEMVRDAAINGADIDQLSEAITRLENNTQPDAETLEALAKLRTRLDEVIRRHQN